MTLATLLFVSVTSIVLLAQMPARADETASGHAGCDADGCQAGGEAGISCSSVPLGTAQGGAGPWLVPLAAMGLVAARRPRRRA